MNDITFILIFSSDEFLFKYVNNLRYN